MNWFAQVVHKLSKKHSNISKHLNGFVPHWMDHKRIPTDSATADIVKQYICGQCKTKKCKHQVSCDDNLNDGKSDGDIKDKMREKEQAHTTREWEWCR